tara:strand:- start:281 stop:883 length:603 start_codon:yes stop_codon:yes gene_type:complete
MNKLKKLLSNYNNLEYNFSSNNSFTVQINKSETSNFKEVFSLIEHINLIEKFSCVKINQSSNVSLEFEFCNVARKYNTMYTTGCFDIFHYGHLNIIKRTKEMCNYLIVGVSTDELIFKEKGKYPLIPFDERIKVIESIKYVDLVIPQIDKNKQKIVDKYLIDAISVGSDWKGKYPKTSCPVEYFQYTKNISSSVLKEKIK